MSEQRPPHREAAIAASRAIYRKYRIRNNRELYDAVNNLIASIDSADADMLGYQKQLVDLACDIEGPLYYPPELPSNAIEPRGELDAFTIRSNHG